MDIDFIDCLNGIYKPLYEKTRFIYDKLKEKGYIVSYGWFNMHSVKHNDKFVIEYYPIPVIKVYNMGDIGIDMDSIFIECTLSKENSLKFDFNELTDKYTVEVYGTDDYMNDYYNKNLDIENLKSRINLSNEKQLKVCVYMNTDVCFDELLEVVSYFYDRIHSME